MRSDRNKETHQRVKKKIFDSHNFLVGGSPKTPTTHKNLFLRIVALIVLTSPQKRINPLTRRLNNAIIIHFVLLFDLVWASSSTDV